MLMETNLDGSPSGFRVLYPSGAQDVYEEAYDYAFFLSQQIDPRGNTTTYIYSTNSTSILLQYVIDGDGKTNTFTYTNIIAYENEGCGPSEETNSCYVSQITDPYGRTVKFNYPGNGTILTNYNGYMGLTNIVDPTGISSSFYYTNGAVIQLTTPYGNTAFYYWNDWYEGGNSEMMLVTEPNGSHQMFLYAGDEYGYNNYLSAIPTVYTDPSYVPTNPPVDNSQGGNTLDNPDWNNPDANDYMRWANSFYWGRQQFANLSSTFLATSNSWDPTALTVNDYALPRLRHWLQTPDQAQGNSLSMERDPSPDGATPGEMTWYDYPGKSDFYIQGTLDTPTLKIKVLPDGTEQYEIYQLDQWGHPTNVISTYSVNGTILLRTNSYIYSTNGIDLLASIGPDGVTDASYAYDTNHQVLFMTNALGEVTCYTYNTYEQPTSIIQPNGLVTTNIYGSDGFLAQQIVIGYSTNSYTYTNGLVYTHTDERGLTTTNTWDALNRLVKVSYPDGTFTSYIYSNLDLVETVDRLGFHTYYGYNPIEQKIAETNALGNVTRYNYCQCGALESIEDALDNVTYFTHDNQGNLTQTTYPDGYTVDNTYNLLRQLITTTDSGGMSVTNTYNNQGLLTASRNNAGLVKSLTYDVDDRITNAVDDNDVSVNMTYDNLDRLLTRSYPDGGVEKWGYTPDVPGPTGYTNQIGNVTLYGYDAMDRKTNEVFVGVTTNKFAYDGASDLLALTDGKNDTTSWVYDSYGRMTNKVDAADNLLFVYRYDADNRLTNRWSAAKGSTIYSYDAVGNLTHVAYPVSPAISLSYDALNRLTNMVDAVGTTVYTYNQVGQLLSEGGLWPDDTVSYTYANRLRTGLSLLAPNASAWKQSYGYDSARRLTSVTSPAGSFDYTYDRSQLLRVDKLSLPNGAYITNTYDSTARLTGTYLKNGDNANLDSYAYGYNLAGERTNVVRTTGDYVNYTYDNEGELVTANAKEPGGVTNRWQEQFGYAYDAAGNLNNRTNNALVQTFGVNNLNELTGAARVGNLTVAGTTTSPATNVTVNSQMASLYADATFAATNFTLADGDNTFTAIARDSYGRMDTNSITVNLPATNSFSYDLNGNLLSDGTRSFGYDDENELISVCVSNNWSNSFVYDGKMRRRIEKDYAWNGSSWQQTNEVHFVYDGNVVIQERNGNNLPQVSYTRGNDLSGTLQGAGGIGGLLSRSDNSQMLAGDTSAHAYYHADGSGNITMMLNPSQAIVAKYLYDPFGNTLSMSGTLAEVNVYRFSSKEWNDNAGLYYYLYRFYDPNLQRWPNRDPLGDAGSSLYGPLSKHRNYFNPVFDAVQQKDGLNLYEMARNN
ncbi:MAG TPA: RHS repeat-associated core domain-containing protein, partial [Candidatus Aquilonibacter sp.]|nr:RHS repeat-associated core domain-containing protein [Candidatus Aquilonibacter sp.]